MCTDIRNAGVRLYLTFGFTSDNNTLASLVSSSDMLQVIGDVLLWTSGEVCLWLLFVESDKEV